MLTAHAVVGDIAVNQKEKRCMPLHRLLEVDWPAADRNGTAFALQQPRLATDEPDW